MIIGSIVIGLILGLVGFAIWWYYKDWKDRKYIKENKDILQEKIQKQKNKFKEVKHKRENDWKRISKRTKQEHREGTTASGSKPSPSGGKPKDEDKKSSEESRGIQVSGNNNTLRP